MKRKQLVLALLSVYMVLALLKGYQFINRTKGSEVVELNLKKAVAKEASVYRLSPLNKLYHIEGFGNTYMDSNYVSEIILAFPQNFELQKFESIGGLRIGSAFHTLKLNALTSVELPNKKDDLRYYSISFETKNRSIFPFLNKISNWKGDAYWLVNSLFFFLDFLPKGFLKFVFAYLLLPLTTASFLYRFKVEAVIGKTGLYALSLPVSWLFNSLALFYAILLFPLRSAYFYLLILILIYLVLFLLFGDRKVFRLNASLFPKSVSLSKSALKVVLPQGINLLASLLLLLLAAVYLGAAIMRSQELFFGSSDIMIYAGQAKAFALFPQFSFSGVYINELAQYPRLSYHAPGYSFMLLFEYFINTISGSSGESFFKAINPMLAFFSCVICWQYFSRYHKIAALFFVLVLCTTWGLSIAFLSYHIDAFRYFFIFMLSIFLVEAIKRKETTLLVFIAILSGLSAFLHSINVIISCGFLLAVVLFFPFASLRHRAQSALTLGLILLLFGGSFYALDVLIGTGWILR